MKQQLLHVGVLLVTFFALVEGKCEINVQSDLVEILELVSWEKVRELTYSYLEHDNQVQTAYKYLRSKDFLQQLLSLEHITQFTQVVSYLRQSEVNVFSLVFVVHNMVSPPAHLPMNSTTYPEGTGVMGLVEDILYILPKKAFKVLITEKLESSDSFRAMMRRLSTKKFQDLVENLIQTTEVHNLEGALASNFIELKNIVHKIKNDFNDNDL